MEYQKKVTFQVLKYLNDLPRNYGYISNNELLEAIRAEGDNILSATRINDAVNYLAEKGAVEVTRTLSSSLPFDFSFVKISRRGRNILIRGEDIFRKWDREDYSQTITIHSAKDSTIQITQRGDNVIVTGEYDFKKLKEIIKLNKLYSEEGKQEILENVITLEEENKKKTPNIGKAQQAFNWLKLNTPPFIREIITNLIANLIAQGITL